MAGAAYPPLSALLRTPRGPVDRQTGRRTRATGKYRSERRLIDMPKSIREPCVECGGPAPTAWVVAVRVDNGGWRWATACTSCMWDKPPGKTPGIRGKPLQGELVKGKTAWQT